MGDVTTAAATTAASLPTTSTLPPPSTDMEITATTSLQQMSPLLCKQGLLYRFEELANQLSAGWKYHVANTDGIKDSWTKFEDFYQSICSFTEGKAASSYMHAS